MKREYLKELGLEDEIIGKIMAEHGKSVQAAKPTDYDDLKSAKETLEKQIEKLNGTLQATNDKYTQQESTLGELEAKVKGYEVDTLKTRIANQAGLPLDLAGRLSGETEDEIKADAEKFASFVSKPAPLPLKGTEQTNDQTSPYKNMLDKLNLEGE